MADIKIMIGDTELKNCSAETRQKLYAIFVEHYYTALKHDVATKPEEYAWRDKSDEEVKRVVAKIMTAIYHGRANNSNALKRAAKRIGLNGAMKYTRAFVQQCLVAGVL